MKLGQLSIDNPIITGELLDKLLEKNIEVTHSQLLHYLKRLEGRHIVTKIQTRLLPQTSVDTNRRNQETNETANPIH